MSYADYIIVLEAIVTGFVISYLLAKWGQLLNDEKNYYWIPVVWSISLMLHLLFRWWFDFHYRLGELYEQTGFGYLLYFMARPFLIYLSAIILFKEKECNNYQCFAPQIRLTFIVLAFMWGFDVIDWAFIRNKSIFGGAHRIQPLTNLVFALILAIKPSKIILILATIVAIAFQLILFYYALFIW